VRTFVNGATACIADGCNWGARPKKASNVAKDTFVSFLDKASLKTIKTIRDAGKFFSLFFYFIKIPLRERIFESTNVFRNVLLYVHHHIDIVGSGPVLINALNTAHNAILEDQNEDEGIMAGKLQALVCQYIYIYIYSIDRAPNQIRLIHASTN